MIVQLIIVCLAIIFDLLFREPPSVRFHPVMFIGGWINKVWQVCKHKNKTIERINGALFSGILVVVFAGSVYLLLEFFRVSIWLYIVGCALILSPCFSISAFFDTANLVKESLNSNNLKEARQHVRFLVTRKTDNLNKRLVSSAAVESIGENLCDALIAPLFYFFIFGVPGAVACRIINLLDGILGVKTTEKRNIGWFPAKLDDVAQFIPARLTFLLIVIASFVLGKNAKNAIKIAVRDHKKDDGINSGWTIGALAGALDVQLENPGLYIIGDKNKKLDADKIDEALAFVAVLPLLVLCIAFICFCI